MQRRALLSFLWVLGLVHYGFSASQQDSYSLPMDNLEGIDLGGANVIDILPGSDAIMQAYMTSLLEEITNESSLQTMTETMKHLQIENQILTETTVHLQHQTQMLTDRIDTMEEHFKMDTEQQSTSTVNTRVAFEAYFTEGGSFQISLDAPIAFSHVALNVGNAYDNFTGIFTAPIAGVYLFILSTKKDPHNSPNGHHMVLGIYVNDRLERKTDVAYKTTTAMLVSLNVGDTVYVEHYLGDTELDKWWDTSFTGILLFPLN